eukprot:4412983-Heterocapsa_arctica.AAC.1
MGEENQQGEEEPAEAEGEECPEVDLCGMIDSEDERRPFYIDERREFNLLTEDREAMYSVTGDHGGKDGWVK